jgi:tetratricopeptide (TPR) repeat protein
MVVVPNAPTLDESVVDIFRLGIKFSNLVRALKEMDRQDGFRGDGWDSSIRRSGGSIVLRFAYKHAPTKSFETRLSEVDSRALDQLFQDCLSGKALLDFDVLIPQVHSKIKVGRNDPCPCGSGKKYKKCCDQNQSRRDTPALLIPFTAVEDQAVQSLLAEAARDFSCLKDFSFWCYLGRELGSAGEYTLALRAHTEATQLNPSDETCSADYAATLSIAGRHQEALDKLFTLANHKGRFSVLIANALSGLNRYSEAIYHYEQAIEFEPEFSFSYNGLLDVMRTVKHPLYEYWLRRAVRQFPKSATIAVIYCRWLMEENRLEQLANAAWIDNLEYCPDPRVVGRYESEPRLIVEAQILRLLGLSIHEESAEPLERATGILDASPRSWHLCDSASRVAFLAAPHGRRDLIWKASRKFCESCRAARLGTTILQRMLAHSSLVSNRPNEALQDIEVGLDASPGNVDLMNLQWWALDEAGRPEEAIPVARKVHEQLPTFPHLSYNIGYLCGKTGRLATAIDYYEKEILQDSENLSAIENLILIRLFEGKVELATQMVERWSVLASSRVNSLAVHEKRLKFEYLAEFALANQASPTLAYDLKHLNEKSEPFWGAHTRIPERKLSHEELVRALDLDAGEQKEIKFSMEMERRGDFSATVARLSTVLPDISVLPNDALLSIVEAQRQLDDSSRADYAPAILAFCKTIEITLRDQVFVPFRKIALSDQDYGSMAAQAIEEAFAKAASFTRFVTKGAHLELGGMSMALQLCGGRTGRDMQMLSKFNGFIVNDLRRPKLFDRGFTEAISNLARNYRNPAAHASSFDRQTALKVRDDAIQQLRIIHEMTNG